jgi:hypothetical protein
MSRDLLKLISEKFTSGNSIEVERITITRAEYEQELAKPEQELDKFNFCGRVLDWNRSQEKPPIEIPKEYWVAQELWNLFYTAPPRKEWVGLTEHEIWECQKLGLSDDVYKAIEAALRSKNT